VLGCLRDHPHDDTPTRIARLLGIGTSDDSRAALEARQGRTGGVGAAGAGERDDHRRDLRGVSGMLGRSTVWGSTSSFSVI
jgi:hypothetical protein